MTNYRHFCRWPIRGGVARLNDYNTIAMADFITELKERRVLPAIGVYAASCWVLVEILDRLVERYLLSPYLTDIVFWGLYSLIPAVILVTWSYGRPGRDKATTAQKVGVPINIIATMGLLITAFGGKDLGATASMVTMANELGQQETYLVPNESFRRRMAVFFFDNESGDPSHDWLQYGVTDLLVQDLQQDPFVLATSPYENFGNGFYARMRQAGFMDATGIPTSLKREIAQDANRQYFVEGAFTVEHGEYVVTTTIWETQTLDQVATISQRGWNLYDTIDRLSREVRKELDVPRSRTASDMPLAETYGESQSAFQNYIAGLNERLFNNDFAASNALFDAALEEDHNFVLAHFVKAMNLIEGGDLPSAQVSLNKAQQLDYRLPDRDRVILKANNYRLSGETDKLIEFLRMQVKLSDDAASHGRLGNILFVSGELEEAKHEYKIALQRDSLNAGINLILSKLERSTGDMNAAITYAREYQKERPEDIEAHIQMGDLLRDSGELDQAERHYEQAQLLENNPVQPTLRLVIIAARKGDENKARQLLEQAEALAQTPTDRGDVHQAASFLEARLGRIDAAIEQLYAAEVFFRQTLAPFQVALATYDPIVGLNLHRGDVESAEAALASGMDMVQPPMDKFLAFCEARIFVQRGDLDQAGQTLGRGVEIIEQFKFDALRFQITLTEADIHKARGDYAGQMNSLKLGLQQIDRSFIAAELYAQWVPKLYAELANAQVLAGDLDGAEESLGRGFRLDPSEPNLWSAKARLQKASGLSQLAAASINYALAIWQNADPQFDEWQEARALASEIAGTTN